VLDLVARRPADADDLGSEVHRDPPRPGLRSHLRGAEAREARERVRHAVHRDLRPALPEDVRRHRRLRHPPHHQRHPPHPPHVPLSRSPCRRIVSTCSGHWSISVTSRPAFVNSPPTTHPIAPAPTMPIRLSMPAQRTAGRSPPASPRYTYRR